MTGTAFTEQPNGQFLNEETGSFVAAPATARQASGYVGLPVAGKAAGTSDVAEMTKLLGTMSEKQFSVLPESFRNKIMSTLDIQPDALKSLFKGGGTTGKYSSIIGDVATGIGAATDLYGAYLGGKQLKLAERGLGLQQDALNINTANSITAGNNQLAGLINSRLAARGIDPFGAEGKAMAAQQFEEQRFRDTRQG